jgi:hypothetical protein
MNIPMEAVRAAHSVICEQNIDDCLDPDWRGKCVKAVEAAAPFLNFTHEEPHFGCPDCGEREGCDCRWKGVL